MRTTCQSYLFVWIWTWRDYPWLFWIWVNRLFWAWFKGYLYCRSRSCWRGSCRIYVNSFFRLRDCFCDFIWIYWCWRCLPLLSILSYRYPTLLWSLLSPGRICDCPPCLAAALARLWCCWLDPFRLSGLIVLKWSSPSSCEWTLTSLWSNCLKSFCIVLVLPLPSAELYINPITLLENRVQLIDWRVIFLSAHVLQNLGDLSHAFIFESSEWVDFGRSANVAMVGIVVFDALWAEGFDAGVGWAEVGEGLAIVFLADVFDELGG